MDKQYNNNQSMCVALTESFILVGNQLGELLIYDKVTKEPCDYFIEKGKDF